MIRQTAFDLGAAPAFRAEDYLIAPPNAAAHAQVMAQVWPGGRLMILGPAGSGKSHLARVWAASASAQVLEAAALGRADLALIEGPLLIEDAERLAGDLAAEEALFHLWNRGAALLVTAARPPGEWGLRLPDLASRMQAMPLAALAPPDEALLAAVLVKLFADRQVAVQPSLIAYLLARMERSIGAARSLVAALDAEALAQGVPITRALAARLPGANGDLDTGKAE